MNGFFSRFVVLLLSVLFLVGCSSPGNPSPKESTSLTASKRKAPDGRTVEIGHAVAGPQGGLTYKNPHFESCWIADGFDFNGYDTLYIAPTLSTAKFNPKEEERPHDLAKQRLATELQTYLGRQGLFANVVTQDSGIMPGKRTLTLENTITEYAKGGGGARYFAGLYGAGQPALRVAGKMTENGKDVFTYVARRSGVSAGARISGGFMKDEDIQIQDIRSLALDLTDFVSAIARKPLVNTRLPQ